jgi:predicted enzyme related to lactoylglutathione lyase
MADPVVHFEIVGTNAAPLRSFYGHAFGWNLAPEPNTDQRDAAVENGSPKHCARGQIARLEEPQGHTIGLIQPA